MVLKAMSEAGSRWLWLRLLGHGSAAGGASGRGEEGHDAGWRDAGELPTRGRFIAGLLGLIFILLILHLIDYMIVFNMELVFEARWVS